MIADLLAQRISRVLGMRPGPGWEGQIDQALAALATVHALPLAALLDRLVADEALLVELASYLTVDESYFVRHPEQYPVVVEHVRRALGLATSAQAVTLWSVGCARGEEPLSVAIMLREALGEDALGRVKIIATDVSGRAVATAARGTYRRWSFRSVPQWLIQRYFEPGSDGDFVVAPDIRKAVAFEQAEVERRLELTESGSIDVVLFRNVGIYFEQDKLHRVYAGLARVLRPQGLLVAAPADPPPPRRLFDRAEGGVIGTYAHRAVAPLTTAVTEPLAAPGPVAPKHPAASTRRSKGGKVHSHGQSVTSPASDRKHEPPYSDAALCSARAREHLEGNRIEAAVAEFRRALFLDGANAVTRFWYAAALHRAGLGEKARVQVETLARQLDEGQVHARLDDDTPYPAHLRDAVALMKASTR